LPGAQSAADTHTVTHAPALHAYAPHDTPVPVVQLPAPSHTCPDTVVGPVHVVGPQLLPGFALARQAPLPSHEPSGPHAFPDAAHALFGSVSGLTGPQSPVEPVTL
jgi:hypothetical protein